MFSWVGSKAIQPMAILKWDFWLTWDIEILGWCPARPVLPHGGEGASLVLVENPSSVGVTILIMPYGVDVLHCFTFSYWAG